VTTFVFAESSKYYIDLSEEDYKQLVGIKGTKIATFS
jgi:hypothetical protein